MNSEDFRRNFAQSYLGIIPSIIAPYLKGAGYWDRLDLNNPQTLIPGTSPSFHQDGTVSICLQLKLIDRFEAIHVRIPWREDMDEDPNFCFSRHPRFGMVYTEDTIGFLRRFPQRHYHRGYCPRACNMVVPNAYSSITQSSTNSPPVVWSVFNPNYKTLKEALEILEDGIRIGVPIERQLGICLEAGRRFPRIVYRNEIVGFIQNGDPIVYSDSSDACRDYITKVTGKIPKVK
jgi:hypothetical protein